MNYLTKKQLAILIFFIPLAFKMAMLPSLLYKECGASFYVGIGIITALEFLQLAVILKIVSFGGFEKIEKTFGKVAKYALALPFLFTIMIKTIIFSAEIFNYTTQYLFYNISPLPIIFALCVTAFYVAVKGAKTIGRIYELSVWLIPLIVIFGVFFGKSELCADYLLPVFENGVTDTIKGLDKYIIYTFDFSPLLFFRIEKGKNLSVIISSVLSVLAVTGCYMIFLVSYGRASFLIPDAFARLASFNTVVSEIGSLDWPSSILWISVSVANIGLKLCAIGEIGSFFNLKKPWLIGLAAVVTAIVLMTALATYDKIIALATSAIRYAVVGIEIVVPIVMLILTKIKLPAEVSLETKN